MIHKKIEKLIPYLSEEFITYPLWEEGKYIPFVKFWQKVENENEELLLYKNLKNIFNIRGYVVAYEGSNYSNTIHQYSIYPEYTELENGGYEFENKDWSIEEILDLLGSVLK